ncbi:MAG TPA: MFS transporter [Thermoplasmata archaeon]|nr:MFS transporter [Thermoplasmata archaeon]
MAEPGGRSDSTYGRLFRNPSFLRVFSAGLGSVAGSSITGVCLVWIVYTDTRSALDVALLGVSWLAAGILFSVLGGAWADRYDRRRLMVLADYARAAALGGIVVLLDLDRFELLPILAAYFVVGAFTTVFNPAEQAIVPSIVPAELVADANGLVRSSRSAFQFVGASVAGLLIVTLGPVVGVGANAVTFLLSGSILLGMRAGAVPARPGVAAAAPSYFREVREGFRWLARATGFLQLTISATFFNFCYALVGTFLVIFATAVLHGSALVYALLLAVEVAGSAVGALLVGRTGAVRWAGRAWVVPYGAASAAVVLALVEWPVVPVALAALFALGLLAGFAGTAWLTAAQLLVPTEVQGRYFGIDSLGSIAILPAAQIGGAFLIVAYGVRETYLLAGILWLIAGLGFVLPRALWNLGYRPSPADPTPRSDADASGTTGSPEGTRAA